MTAEEVARDLHARLEKLRPNAKDVLPFDDLQEESRARYLAVAADLLANTPAWWQPTVAKPIALVDELRGALVDLLEAAERVDEELAVPADKMYFSPPLLSKCRAAIDKATPKQTCPKCGGSGGGGDPTLVCGRCFGTGRIPL